MKPSALLLMPCLAASTLHAGERVEGQALVDCARTALLAHTPELAGELELIASMPATSNVEADGPIRCEAGQIAGAWPRRRIGVPVTLWHGTAPLQSRMVWFTVRQWRDVQVYGRDAASGEPADRVPLQTKRTDVLARATDEPLYEQPAHARLRRTVRRGQLAVAGDFETMPAVSRNEQVRLRLQGDGLQLTTQAIARRDGQVGEWIEVTPSDGTLLRARVTQPNEVMIEQ